MFLFFSVARSQENGSWERAAEVAQGADGITVAETKPKNVSKAAQAMNFGTNMPMMCSAFDTAMWLTPA